MPGALRCPSCFQPVGRRDIQCPRCELLLEGQLDQPIPDARDISVVKALMEAPQARPSRGPPPPPPELTPEQPLAARKRRVTASTRVFQLPPSLDGVPKVVAALRMTDLNLTPFEAWAVSLVDGRSKAGALQPASGLAPFEFQILLGTLVDKGVLTMTVAEAPKPKPVRAPEPAAVPPPIIERFPVAPPKPAVEKPPVAKPAAARPATAPQAAVVSARPVTRVPLPAPAPPPAITTDPRILVGEGVSKNRKLLDALKQVKRSDARPTTVPSAPPVVAAPPVVVLPPPSPARPQSRPDELATESALQVAIRMEQDGRFPEAIRYLERAIARSPDAAPLYNRLAIILVRDRRDFREAERLMKKALQLAPDHAVYKKNLVSILHSMAS